MANQLEPLQVRKQKKRREHRKAEAAQTQTETRDNRPLGTKRALDWEPDPATLAHKLTMGFAVVGPFLGVIGAIIATWQWGWMGWQYLALLVGLWVITAWGITVGFHRLMSHRSFETYRWVRGFWMIMGALAVQGSPLVWCALHRRHHEVSDLPGDPHSPRLHEGDGYFDWMKSFWHSHSGWLFQGDWQSIDTMRYVPDLAQDRLLVWIDQFYYVWVLASLAIPTAIGGLMTLSWQGAFLGFVWGGLVRIFINHHMTWSINSVCHIFGSRAYHTTDHSTNNVIFGVLSMGEGWHNNHHAFPTSARHGLEWWQFDSSWLVISAMKACGLAWRVRLPNPKLMDERRIVKT